MLALCVECLRASLEGDAPPPRTDLTFRELGLDSRSVLAFIALLSQRLERRLDSALPFAHPTLARLAAHLSGQASEPAPTAQRPADEPVAIIGISCRLPGGVDCPETFWSLLDEGRDAVGAWPSARFLDLPAAQLAQMPARGGFIADVSGFDAAFFGVSPREAAELDPQQRLMLELSWEALEDAATIPASLHESRTGVFVGCMWSDYMQRSCPVPEAIDQHSATGLDTSVIAARISYRLGLRGPSLTVNTACSSSLVAVHLACQSLRLGESTLAIAGGVNLILSPHSSIAMQRFGGLSPDGRCKAFDAAADGYVRGEGGGVVVLKLLRDAQRDGDPIYCVIRGSSVNNDGASNGLTAPSPSAQAALLRDAYARAGVDARHVQYVEAHGTGTSLGDPIEACALGEVLGAGRGEHELLRIGSVKTNLGHLEAAAGIAGLIKVALSIQRRWLPKSLHFERENPELSLLSRGLSVQQRGEAWPRSERPALAGVSAFGFGGTNAHVVLEGLHAGEAQLLAIAADDPATLAERTERVCAAARELSSAAELSRLCELSALHWKQGKLRKAACVSQPEDVAAAFSRSVAVPSTPAPRLLFVFSGVGSQWLGMAAPLLAREPIFRAAIEACDAAIAPLSGFSVLSALRAPDERTFSRCDRYEPLIFSVQVGLCALLRSWEISPDAVIGHSIGEVAAAYCAGILTLDAAALVICRQSQLLSRLEGQGAMALIAKSALETEALIASGVCALDAEELALAACNGEHATVISGPVDSVRAVQERARERGIFAAQVRTEVAFHSPAVERLAGRMSAALSGLWPSLGHTRMLSTVTCAWLSGIECDAAYWVENQCGPVRFRQALEQLRKEGRWVALELAPHALLTRELRDGLASEAGGALALPTLQRGNDARDSLLHSIAALYEAGFEPSLPALARSVRPSARLPETALRKLPLTSSADQEPSASAPVLTLPLSAQTPEALREQAERFRAHLASRPDLQLEDLVHKAASGRSHFAHRLTVSGSSRHAMCEGLAAYSRGDHAPFLTTSDTNSKHGARIKSTGPVFVFSGHGSQWQGMCRELLRHEPVFRAQIEHCELLFEAHGVHALRAQLERDSDALERADTVQPQLFAVQVALAALWRSWGVEPAAVIGHSVGEIAAAHVAGCLDLESAARAVCERAQVIAPAIGRGGMVVVELSRADAERVVARYAGRLAVAVHQSPRFSVLSGELQALEEVVSELDKREVFCRKVQVDYASHGPQMVALAEHLERRLYGLQAAAPRIPMMSTSTGAWLDTAACDASYWARNLRCPVRFDGALGALVDAGFETFLELSPHPLLANAMQEIGQQRGRRVAALPSLRRHAPERATLKESLGALFSEGHEIDWTRQCAAGDLRVPLPSYAFQRTPHWKSVTGLRAAEPVTGVVRKLPEAATPPTGAQLAPLQQRLRAADEEQRASLLRSMLLRELARVLRADSSRLDPEMHFSSLGLDSLLGLELRNRVEAELGIAIPGNLLWSRPNVLGLEQYVLERIASAQRSSRTG